MLNPSEKKISLQNSFLRFFLSACLIFSDIAAIPSVAWFLISSMPAQAEAASRVMNFQGRLTNTSNNPQTGSFDFKFRLFDAPSGGNQLWPTGGVTEDQTLPVSNGVFSAQVGSVTPIPLSAFQVADGTDVYLEIQVQGETLSPRQKMLAVPYAMTLMGRTTAHFVSTGAVTQSIAGDKTFTGDASFSGTITVPAPASAGHAVTKAYVDSLTGGGSSAAVLVATQAFSGQNSFTKLVTVSSTVVITGNVGIGTISPVYALEAGGASAPRFGLSDTGLAHGITDVAQTGSYFMVEQVTDNDGGARLWGFSDSIGQNPLRIVGAFGNTDPTDTVPAIWLIGGKRSGTSVASLGSSETVLAVSNNGGDVMTVLGGGNVGIGTNAPSSKFDLLNGSITIRGTNAGLSVQGGVGIGTPVSSTKLRIWGGHGDTQMSLHSTGNNTATTEADLFFWASEPGCTFTGVGFGNNVRNWNGVACFERINTARGGSYLRLLDNGFSFNSVNSSGVDANAMYIVGGNVGIGSTAPNAKLAIGNNLATGFLDTYAEYQQILNDGGTAGTSYGFGIKANTMIFNSGAGAYSFERAGNTTLVSIDTNGNVGVGSTAPKQLLDVAGNIRLGNHDTNASRFIGFTTNDSFSSTSGSGMEIESVAVGSYSQKIHFLTHYYGVSDARRVTINYDGNVGIGSTAPIAKLDISVGAIKLGVTSAPAWDTNGFLWVEAGVGNRYDGYSHRFDVGGSRAEAMRITAGGFVGIGTNAPNAKLHVQDSTAWAPVEIRNGMNTSGGADWSAGVRMIEMYGLGSWQGEVYANGSGMIYGNGSDYRLKENIKPINPALNRLMDLKAYQFNYKKSPGQISEGFLAHEVQSIAPYAVSGKKDEVDAQGNPVYQSVDYGRLTPLLVKSVQELKLENDRLKERIKALEEKIENKNR